ncbi:MAG: PqqD family protein [Clostridia bacterium]|nr:PqqD family protein [Clostridia bacterium]
MKIKEGFIKRKVVGKWVVVPTEKLSKQYNGIIELNDTANEIWEGIEKGLSAEEIATAIVEDFEVSYENALQDIHQMIEKMVKEGIIEE